MFRKIDNAKKNVAFKYINYGIQLKSTRSEERNQ